MVRLNLVAKRFNMKMCKLSRRKHIVLVHSLSLFVLLKEANSSFVHFDLLGPICRRKLLLAHLKDIIFSLVAYVYHFDRGARLYLTL